MSQVLILPAWDFNHGVSERVIKEGGEMSLKQAVLLSSVVGLGLGLGLGLPFGYSWAVIIGGAGLFSIVVLFALYVISYVS